jgi:hypothetical protein
MPEKKNSRFKKKSVDTALSARTKKQHLLF